MHKKIINRGTNIIVTNKKKLEMDQICINTDGPVTKNNEAGYGGLARNCEGVWLGRLSKIVYKCNVQIVELWDVLESLRLALSKGYNRVENQVDNQEATNAIRRKKNQLKDMNLICKVKTNMIDFLEVKIGKNHKEANKSDDTLVKYSLMLHGGGSLEFIECPNFMLNVLLSDISNID